MDRDHTPSLAAASLTFDLDALRPLIRFIAEEVIAAVRATDDRLPDRVAFSEAVAAKMLELEQHQLRDERLDGRIRASRIRGRRIRYLRDDLIAYMIERRI